MDSTNLINTLVSFIKEPDIDARTIVPSCIALMKIVKKMKRLSVDEKKTYVIEAIILYIEQHVDDEVKRLILLEICENTLPEIVERIVEIEWKGGVMSKIRKILPCM